VLIAALAVIAPGATFRPQLFMLFRGRSRLPRGYRRLRGRAATRHSARRAAAAALVGESTRRLLVGLGLRLSYGAVTPGEAPWRGYGVTVERLHAPGIGFRGDLRRRRRRPDQPWCQPIATWATRPNARRDRRVASVVLLSPSSSASAAVVAVATAIAVPERRQMPGQRPLLAC
jgi:hypothetical protein